MGDFGFAPCIQNAEAIADRTAFAGGNSNVKGAWNQLIASTSRDLSEILCQLGSSPKNQKANVDIGIGAAGSETIIIPDIRLEGNATYLVESLDIRFPITIPAGSRIAIRASTESSAYQVGTPTFTCTMTGFSWSLKDVPKISRYFIMPTNPAGTLNVTPGNGVESAWVEIVPSTPDQINHLVIDLFTIESGTPAFDVVLDVGIGAAASEKVIIPNILFSKILTAQTAYVFKSISVPVCIPPGTRIAARALGSISVNPIRVYMMGGV